MFTLVGRGQHDGGAATDCSAATQTFIQRRIARAV